MEKPNDTTNTGVAQALTTPSGSVEIPESLKDIDGCVTRIMGKPMERWTTCPPPRNGKSFVACGRVTWADDSGGGSSPFVSEIYWDAGCEAWCHRKDEEVGMTVARFNDERVHIDHWIDLPNTK